ncbi:hypothetical protein Tco_1093948 [Tanacetum coccineum]|uniref:Uncharacterized protein n=1 Tax=Tanacetum coccineum TaxID=301880 RepID=A0ABQ5IFE6_9ASTR
MSALNQQTLADSGANERPPMFEKWNYIPWESRFKRFLDNKLEAGEQMSCLIEKGPYVRPMITDPDNTRQLMYGFDVTNHVRHSRLMDEFDKFAAKEGESLEYVYERLITLVNMMDRNNVRPIQVSINTKFLNCLQPEWSEYVTMSHASPSYSNSPQPYYVTHPSSFVDYEEDYQGKLQGNVGRQNRNQAFNAGNGFTHNDESNQIVQRVPRTESNPEQMLLAMKDEARSNLKDEENDIMLDNSFGDETLEELTDAVIMMAQIQPADDKAVTEPNYNAKAISEVNASHIMIPKGVHEHKNHRKRKTIVNTSDDDQTDSNIIFDDPYVENNGGSDEHDSNAHDQYHDVKIMAYNVQREAENKKTINQ